MRARPKGAGTGVEWIGVVLCAIVWASGRLTRPSSTQGLDDPRVVLG
jgi:hypothetical protein